MRDFQLPGRSQVFAANGICTTSHPLAARTAVRILEDGGNAVDAAIGAAVLLGLCEPQSTGLGGDLFALIQPPNSHEIIALNGSGRAPSGASSARLRDQGMIRIPEYSADAVTIPGAVDAFCRMSVDYGRKGLAASLAPAIKYAEEGVPVSPRVRFDWQRSAGILQADGQRHFLFDGKPPSVGSLFRAPGQAEVLRRILKSGREGFYEGEVTDDMVHSLRRAGGCHTADDFAATECAYAPPIRGSYGGFDIYECPPNGQGATAILLANILSSLRMPKDAPFGMHRTHLETEAIKLAYDARDRFIADPDTTRKIEHLLSIETAEKLASLIDPDHPSADFPRRTAAIHRDTVLVIVVDRDRMAVSLIYSIFHSFGSGLASRKFGINFQNRGAGFTLEEGHPNELAGRKRPLHTIIPAILRKGMTTLMPFGVMGGQYQAAGHARLISNIVDYGMDPQQALDGPRSFPDNGILSVERGYSPDVVEGLARMGHHVQVPDSPIGGGQAIWINPDNGVLQGASDHRKDGCAIGY
ncbi:MAG: gamma-glutamyltransferase family protein [Rhodobacteraceae bacterium]|nr:gamma-glutamyltransferase family protein [Paracoccaceae bacterium]